MGYPTFYRELERMALNTALDMSTARDIVRKAGIMPGDAATGGNFNPRRMGMLLIADGSEQTPGGGDTAVVYSTLVANDDGYTFTPGASSWTVPTAGLYRVTATLVIGTPSGEGIFGHAHVGLTSGNRAVMQQYHYVPATSSPLPARIVLSGAGTAYLDAGESASHVFYRSAGTATPGNILQDSAASRLYVEKVL